MQKLGVPLDHRVHRRFERSMQYAVDKAMRRGLKSLPLPLAQFVKQAARKYLPHALCKKQTICATDGAQIDTDEDISIYGHPEIAPIHQPKLP